MIFIVCVNTFVTFVTFSITFVIGYENIFKLDNIPLNNFNSHV